MSIVLSTAGPSRHLQNFFDNFLSGSGRMDGPEIRQRLMSELPSAMSGLTDKQKVAFECYFLQGLTQSEIAELTNTTQSSVSKLLYGNLVYSVPGVRFSNRKRIGGACKKVEKYLLEILSNE
jgi:hypothetical protein